MFFTCASAGTHFGMQNRPFLTFMSSFWMISSSNGSPGGAAGKRRCLSQRKQRKHKAKAGRLRHKSSGTHKAKAASQSRTQRNTQGKGGVVTASQQREQHDPAAPDVGLPGSGNTRQKAGKQQ